MNIIYYKCEFGWRIGKSGEKLNTYSYFSNTMGLPKKPIKCFIVKIVKKQPRTIIVVEGV